MTQANLKLVSFALCPFVQRARIILLENKIEHELEFIDLDMPPDWFYDVSPLEKVPVLLVDDEPIFESLVICDYINDISDSNLYPEDFLLKAQQRAWISLSDNLLDLVYELMFATDETKYKQAKASIIDRLEVIEEQLSTGPFYSGEKFAMIDVAYAPLFRFLDSIMSVSDINFYADAANVQTWAKACLAYPAVQNAVVKTFPEDFLVYLNRPHTILTASKKIQ